MKFSLCKGFALGFAFLGSSGATLAGTPASPQATPVPLNLPVAGNVQVTGSDSRAATFNSQWLPKFQTIINDNLSERVVFTNASGFRLDSSKLFLRQECPETIRVYFLAEGAGYRNTLGFAFTPAGSPTPGTPKVIFPNASIGTGSRTVNEPIRKGATQILNATGVRDATITVTPTVFTTSTATVTVSIRCKYSDNSWLKPIFLGNSDMVSAITLDHENKAYLITDGSLGNNDNEPVDL